ncbi:TIGR03826 family flagellar region protein [Paenibacillus humicola]|uniref:TIGR03826 family flagellar region protein n=1 Tax=Paenibacillus humicola TaxID=3110540 RepID=UPI00237ADFB2|nr:TIGR03826 family flagellar region protein [Paenibacillus humicola]
MNVDNCPRCGKLFTKNFRDVCPACIKEIDREYALCADYLRRNRGATTQELSEATGVSAKQITRFIREGRISLVGAPNLGYPCELCGTLIRESHICADCRNKLAKDTDRLRKNMVSEAEKSREQGQGSYQIKDRLWDK